jgi:hypothetical protein
MGGTWKERKWMNTHYSAVGIFDTHGLAQEAVQELRRSRCNIRKLSLIGRDAQTDDHALICYRTLELAPRKARCLMRAPGLWGMLLGAVFMWVPGLGGLVVGGPLAGEISQAIEGKAAAGDGNVVQTGLGSMGIPRESVLKYEMALRACKFVLVFHDTREQVQRIHRVLVWAKATETDLHAAPAVAA